MNNNNIVSELQNKLLQDIAQKIDNITAIYDHIPISPNLPYIHISQYELEDNILISGKVIYITLDFNIKAYYVANAFSSCNKLIIYLLNLNDTEFSVNKYKILSVYILKTNHINKDNTTISSVKTKISLIKTQ